jgi:type IV secretory pathway VirB10-like protein
MWPWRRPRSAVTEATSRETPAPVLDRRVQPAGVLPQHLQAWLLTGVALAMIVIIAWSTHSSPSRIRIPALAQPVEPNQARIEEYQRRLDEEARRLQKEQQQLDELRIPHASGRSPRTGEDASHASTASAGSDHERTLRADNVAFTRRREAPAAPPAVVPQPLPLLATNPTPQQPPPSDLLPEGTLIEAVLLNRLDGTFAGPVICTVSVPVYARDTQRVLVPRGARVLGEAKPVATFGQSRLTIAFHRLLLPDGRRVSLDAAQGLTALGEAGLTDEVDHHYARIFGASLALGLLSGFAQYGTRAGLNESFSDTYRQAAGASVAQSGLHVLDRFTNILPTVTIREGHRLRIYLTHDVPLPTQSAAPAAMGPTGRDVCRMATCSSR